MSDTKDTTLGASQHAEPEPSSEKGEQVLAMSSLAAAFEAEQHALTRWAAIKQNRWSIMWCSYMFFICIMFGFDGLAGSVVVSIPEFRKDFGHEFNGAYVVDANWQLGFQAATMAGLIFGGLAAGFLVNRFGRQITIACAYLLSIAGIFLQVFAKTPAEFFGGKILTGLPLGVFTAVAPTYGSEMAPLAVRGGVTSAMNFFIVLGQLLGYGVMREASFYTGDKTYKVLFATQWGFVAVGLVILPWFPESPYWLVAHGRADKARTNIAKLHDADYNVDGHMAEVHESLARLNQDNESQGSMAECFSRGQVKRTMIALSMFFIQNACGSAWVIGYMSYFIQLAGVDEAKSFDITVGLSGVMVVGNVCGWFFVEFFGRRNTALYGTATLTVTLLVIAILASVNAPGAIWGQIVFMAIWSFAYQGTVGAAAWPIATEAATSRLRAPTLALATVMNGLSSCIWSFSLPYAVNPDQGNMGGKIAYVFAAVLVVAVVFIFFMIPETKGRTYIEIDELWARGVTPRKFAKTNLVTVGGEEKNVQD